MKEIDPAVSKYFSELARKRKNPYYNFKDSAVAKEAGDAGRKTQRIKRQEAAHLKDSSQEESKASQAN